MSTVIQCWLLLIGLLMSAVTSAPIARLSSIEQAADYLGVEVRFMRRLVLERRIRHAKVGKYVRFFPADLDAFVAMREPVQ